MPTYTYKCKSCEHTFDTFQKMTDEALEDCPECGKAALRKVYKPGGGIIFKGSGFYTTDYRKKSYKEAQKSETANTSCDAKTDSPACASCEHAKNTN